LSLILFWTFSYGLGFNCRLTNFFNLQMFTRRILQITITKK
jgi:hypothetical protein